jgi:hypothetical protein
MYQDTKFDNVYPSDKQGSLDTQSLDKQSLDKVAVPILISTLSIDFYIVKRIY